MYHQILLCGWYLAYNKLSHLSFYCMCGVVVCRRSGGSTGSAWGPKDAKLHGTSDTRGNKVTRCHSSRCCTRFVPINAWRIMWYQESYQARHSAYVLTIVVSLSPLAISLCLSLLLCKIWVDCQLDSIYVPHWDIDTCHDTCQILACPFLW